MLSYPVRLLLCGLRGFPVEGVLFIISVDGRGGDGGSGGAGLTSNEKAFYTSHFRIFIVRVRRRKPSRPKELLPRVFQGSFQLSRDEVCCVCCAINPGPATMWVNGMAIEHIEPQSTDFIDVDWSKLEIRACKPFCAAPFKIVPLTNRILDFGRGGNCV